MSQSGDSSITDSTYQTDCNCTKFCSRVTETCTSGILRPSNKHPLITFLLCIPVFLTPLFLATPFLVLLEVPIGQTPFSWYYSIGYGILMFVVVTTLHSIVWVVNRRKRAKTADIHFSHSSPPTHLSFYSNSLFPDRRNVVNILVQGLTSGILCGLALAALLPSQLKLLFDYIWILFFILGWLAVSLAQFNLSSNAPIETAVPTQQSHSLLQIEILSRPAHVLFLLILAVIIAPFNTVIAIVFYSILCGTPLLWVFGVLPPFSQFLPVLSERCVMLLFGGTSLASRVCVVILCVIWWVYVYLVSLIACSVAAVIVSALVSYLLSLNLFGLSIHLFHRISTGIPLKYSILLTQTLPFKPYVLRNNTPLSTKYWLLATTRYLILPLLSISLLITCHVTAALILNTSVCSYVTPDNSTSYNNTAVLYSIQSPAFFWLFFYFGVISLVPLISCSLLSSLQTRTILCNTLNNPFYPANIYNELDYADYLRESWKVRIASISIQILREYLSRVISMSFLGFFLYSTSNVYTPSFFLTISVVRALHLVWRAPLLLNLHITLVVFVDLLLVTNLTWSHLSVGVHLLIVGVSVEYLKLLTSQLYTILIYLGWYVVTPSPATLTYLREEKTYLSLLSFLLLPISILFLPLSALLTLTLIPIFTLPVFLPSYPHMTSFWSSQGQHSSWGVREAIFYEEVCPEVCRTFKQLVRQGVILSLSCGQIFLIRYEDRIIVVTVLEVGYQYTGLSYKGLELETTSCHDIEATQIDDMLEGNKTSNSVLANLFNKYLLYLVTPLSHAVINTYSEAKSSLRPVVNSKDTIRKCEANFPKCFAWLLIREVIKLSEKNNSDLQLNLTQKGVKKQQPSEIISSPDRPADPSCSTDKLENTGVLANYRQVWGTGYNSDPLASDSISEFESPTYNSTPHQLDPTEGDLTTDLSLDNHNDESQIRLIDASTFLPHDWLHPPDTHSRPVASIDRELLLEFCSYWKDRRGGDIDWNQVESITRRLTTAVSCIIHPASDVPSNKLTGTQICKNYQGQFPWLESFSWLTNSSLLRLATTAYRYTLKLTTDEVVLMEETADLLEYLLELDKDWFIGCTFEEGWKQEVLTGTPRLFLLSKSKKGTRYYNHTLTLKPQLVHVAALQPESLRGMWSSQLFELLFLKNEEEERYSVQQEEHVLRNISTQAGDAPVGYPVFSSAPLYT